jgi:hypothetical protein
MMAGNALANATATPPISRADAGRRVEEFLVRVGIVNGDDSWPYRVGKAVIFGSYLNNQEWIGDIDLAIRLERRPEFAERWAEAVLARADAVAHRGRRFRTFVDRLAWAENEVKRYLRGGVRLLSLHDWSTEEPWLRHATHQVLLDDGRAAAPVDGTNPTHSDLRFRSEKRGSGARRLSRRPRGCPF